MDSVNLIGGREVVAWASHWDGSHLRWLVSRLSPHPGHPADEITYTVRYVEAEGVGWREAVFGRLKPVARQGAATVWTLPGDAKSPLLDQVIKNPAGQRYRLPR